ncbi:hypothetical protein CDO52_10280 [Nocardiopsis gilva YIM 90087]|uniref:Uncharacterized protein n=1 Tax=Nocardiopsis gilva YIM 90087 TaxID=1235441 RepID=A0A223S4W5_9ACTN|nr:hypothetical protein [Nocardiopsis gilva]ASU83117.1 hypothetical protein CDO52_10280 [Nocardiopsis gilva YIM 90087]
MLRAARALLAMRHPLDAEIGVSEMLGSWWGATIPGTPGPDVDRRLGEGLVAHAASSGTAAGLALLSGVAVLGTSRRQRVLAKKGIVELGRQGIARPPWASALGEARPVAAYVSGSRFGDTDDLILTFRHDCDADPDASSGAADEAGHALIAVVDHNSGGVLRDAWVTTKVERLLEHCRAEQTDNPMATFDPLDLGHARLLLENALARTDQRLADSTATHADPGTAAEAAGLTGGSLAAHHALLRARLRVLPQADGDALTEPVWRHDRRAMLAARFLASAEAAELSDSYAASRCVDHIIDYGCDRDAGRPLRVSPRKVEAFLLTWLPRRVVLLPAEQEAMPHVLAAWIRWAGPRSGLPEIAVGATLDALWESTAPFTTAYRDPTASFGLNRAAIARLLPDRDLSALPRRMFAFPLLASDLLDGSAGDFDPSTSAGRRALLRLDHFGEYDAPAGHRGKHGTRGDDHATPDTPKARAASEEEIAAHEHLAERLWNGEPPALWAAAQRLLDRGFGRPAVLRTLLDTLEHAEDDDALTAALDEL